MTPEESATQWLESYKRAWEEQNPDLITTLFSEDGKYFETPFLVHSGKNEIRAYWISAPLSQRDIRFQYKIISVTNNQAIVHWTARFNRGDDEIELDGIFMLDFDSRNLCTTLREWWHARRSNCG